MQQLLWRLLPLTEAAALAVNATYNCYKCKDGAWIQMLGLESRRHLPAFLEALGLGGSGIGAKGGATTAEDTARLDAAFATKTSTEWQEIFVAQDVWHQPVLSPAEVVDSEQPNAIGAFVDIPGVGQPLIANPVRFGAGDQTVP